MPIYTYVCKEGHQFDRYLKLEDYKNPQVCDCGSESRKKMMPTMINCDIQSWDYYESPASGKAITSYKQRREDMARHDCVDYDPGMKKAFEKRVEKEDCALDKKIDETVDREWDKMSSKKRENLANELLSGADIKLERL